MILDIEMYVMMMMTTTSVAVTVKYATKYIGLTRPDSLLIMTAVAVRRRHHIAWQQPQRFALLKSEKWK